MAYAIIISPAAKRQLKKITNPHRARIFKRIDLLRNEPRPHGVAKPSGIENYYRVRVGDYRIIYTIEDKELVVLVVTIGERREVYR
jgi:mRNA interferase RelE/StbE